jgi:outer membrane protein, heavy metal efflux system
LKSYRVLNKWHFRRTVPLILLSFLMSFLLYPANESAAQETIVLQDLIDECLKNSPELKAFESRVEASRFRIPQAKALPDPMFMFGYQNEGWRRITIGEEIGSQGMFTLSQMFFFPGKRSLKEEMAIRDSEGLAALYNAARLRLAARIKEVYYDLFLAYKTIDLLKEKSNLFSKIEDAATARYASGMGSQQEVIMAQTEKYMLIEKEEMQNQKIQALQGMLNSTMGRDVNRPLGQPAETPPTLFSATLDELLSLAKEQSPEVKAKEKMVDGAQAKVKLTKREYYPDVTLSGSYFPRTQGFLDMYSLTATVNIPIYYKTKQQQAVLEANASLSEAKRELQATEYMLASAVRDGYSMERTADRLIPLYRDALIPKAQQDVQLGLSGYVSGKTEAITVVSRLKAFLDIELLYWAQYSEREKAIARLEAITGGTGSVPPPKKGAIAETNKIEAAQAANLPVQGGTDE